ncbi:hypothetical protein [Gordonia sp. VNK21]|uniref:hypothetical protein n=1 Tax=Gordonia sp. VNK21 TaxID=3382483 RepID=UPI0038D38C4D
MQQLIAVRNICFTLGMVGFLGAIILPRFGGESPVGWVVWVLLYGLTLGVLAQIYIDMTPRVTDGIWGSGRRLRVPGNGMALSDRVIGVGVVLIMMLAFGIVFILIMGMPLVGLWSLRPFLDDLGSIPNAPEDVSSVDASALSSAMKFYALGTSVAMAIPAVVTFFCVALIHLFVLHDVGKVRSSIADIMAIRNSGYSMIIPVLLVSVIAFAVVKYGSPTGVETGHNEIGGDQTGSNFEIAFDDWQLVTIIAIGMVFSFTFTRMAVRVLGEAFEGYYPVAILVIALFEAGSLWLIMSIDSVGWMMDSLEIRGRRLILDIIGFNELVPNVLVLSAVIFVSLAALIEMRTFVSIRGEGADS